MARKHCHNLSKIMIYTVYKKIVEEGLFNPTGIVAHNWELLCYSFSMKICPCMPASVYTPCFYGLLKLNERSTPSLFCLFSTRFVTAR